MTIQTNTTDRKALAKAIAEALHTEYRYLRMPTCAYEVGGYTIDRYGNITGDDFAPIHDLLVAGGYITDDAEPAAEEPAAEEPATEDAEAPAEAEPEADAEPAEDAQPGEEPTDSEKEQQTAEPATTDSIDEQTITIPAPGITVEQLRNLTYILYSRQYLLNLMTGGDTIRIPVELVEALQEALPATPEDFTTLLDSIRELGLAGFDFKDEQFSLTFPFYETEPTKWTTFAGLQGRILQMALAATRVFPELIQPEKEAEKYTAHIWLQRMGYKGPEMKEQRNILLRHLHGYCAFSNGAKMQNHKDKYSAIRRERREAERAGTAETMVEVTMPTTEAESSVAMAQKEVAFND
ncbi:MAG: hypothetical protein IKD70_09845 [Eggerthellaceae bacterium]|nr:hypothetical protein [Eggerthellaceae bacterium]